MSRSEINVSRRPQVLSLSKQKLHLPNFLATAITVAVQTNRKDATLYAHPVCIKIHAQFKMVYILCAYRVTYLKTINTLAGLKYKLAESKEDAIQIHKSPVLT